MAVNNKNKTQLSELFKVLQGQYANTDEIKRNHYHDNDVDKSLLVKHTKDEFFMSYRYEIVGKVRNIFASDSNVPESYSHIDSIVKLSSNSKHDYDIKSLIVMHTILCYAEFKSIYGKRTQAIIGDTIDFLQERRDYFFPLITEMMTTTCHYTMRYGREKNKERKPFLEETLVSFLYPYPDLIDYVYDHINSVQTLSEVQSKFNEVSNKLYFRGYPTNIKLMHWIDTVSSFNVAMVTSMVMESGLENRMRFVDELYDVITNSTCTIQSYRINKHVDKVICDLIYALLAYYRHSESEAVEPNNTFEALTESEESKLVEMMTMLINCRLSHTKMNSEIITPANTYEPIDELS